MMTTLDLIYIGMIGAIFIYLGIITLKNEIRFIKNSTVVTGVITTTEAKNENIILTINYRLYNKDYRFKTGRTAFNIKEGNPIKVRVYHHNQLHIEEIVNMKHFYSTTFLAFGLLMFIMIIVSETIQIDRNIPLNSVYVYLFMVPFVIFLSIIYKVANKDKRNIGRF